MAETQVSMTYGTMPSFADFETAFDRECPRGEYAIRLSTSDSRACDRFSHMGDGDYNTEQLYAACMEVHTAWVESAMDDKSLNAAMDLVSSIMGTLGFEWI